MAQATIEPIRSDTLPAFASFLQQNMPIARSSSQWEQGLRHQWVADPPNFGFLLRSADGNIVGGIGAYYVERPVQGTLHRFCNITSWCVLDAYRQQSMKLAMTVIKQPGYTFTDFSPTKIVAGTLKFFKFKEIDEREAVLLNLPGMGRGASLLHRASDIAGALDGAAAQVYGDHAGFPWLRHVVFGRPGQWCHVIYKRTHFRSLPAARVVYLSDPALFSRHFGRMAAFLLLHGMVSTHVECRMLDTLPWPSRVRSGFIRKVFLSESLAERDIDYLYSETVALDL